MHNSPSPCPPFRFQCLKCNLCTVIGIHIEKNPSINGICDLSFPDRPMGGYVSIMQEVLPFSKQVSERKTTKTPPLFFTLKQDATSSRSRLYIRNRLLFTVLLLLNIELISNIVEGNKESYLCISKNLRHPYYFIVNHGRYRGRKSGASVRVP